MALVAELAGVAGRCGGCTHTHAHTRAAAKGEHRPPRYMTLHEALPVKLRHGTPTQAPASGIGLALSLSAAIACSFTLPWLTQHATQLRAGSERQPWPYETRPTPRACHVRCYWSYAWARQERLGCAGRPADQTYLGQCAHLSARVPCSTAPRASIFQVFLSSHAPLLCVVAG